MSHKEYIRTSIILRSEQRRALKLTAALGTSPHGNDMSEIIRCLLDKHGYILTSGTKAPRIIE